MAMDSSMRTGRSTRLIRLACVLMLAGSTFSCANAAPADRRIDPGIEHAVAAVSEARLERLLTTLVGFGTRHTYSAAEPARGIRAAAQWIHDELRRSSPRLQVGFDVHDVSAGAMRGILQDVELRNVVAMLPGRSARRIYVTAHYDSYNRGQGAEIDAPGANDNGSGTVLMMEVARALAESGIDFDATLVFMATAAEEQGLVGARLHAARALESGVAIQAVFNNDIVGGAGDEHGAGNGTTVRLYSVGPEDSPSRALARFTHRMAARYVPAHQVQLLARSDRVQRSGDHMAFNQAGITAVGFREPRENFLRQHNARDTLDGASMSYLAQNTRVNVAAVAARALAPPPPAAIALSTSARADAPLALPNTVHVRWDSVEGATGYRLYRRDAWGPDWQDELDVGNVTTHDLPRAVVDESVIGVAAVGPKGFESPVTAILLN
jgi:hypothetical protein